MQWLDSFDIAVAQAVISLDSGPAGRSFTWVLGVLLNVNLIKMGPLVLLLLYTWLRRDGRAAGGVLGAPKVMVRGLIGIALALSVGRLLQHVLPMRQRPRFVHPEIAFPETGYTFDLSDWSSMPSDHAMLVFAMALATWAVSPRLGMVSAAWAALVVCFPRVYFGLHYASDIIVGAALGIALMALALRVPVPVAVAGRVQRWEARQPALMVLGLCVLGWELIELFGTVRQVAGAVGRVARVLSDVPG